MRANSAVPLDREGNPLAGTDDEIAVEESEIMIGHRDPQVWSYRLTTLSTP
ncbi:MAG: hypothetical protein GXY33_17215 [Phycisphaerae bacterium]|nr:hypothetical protein [Phycisphaerae bacterium]